MNLYVVRHADAESLGSGVDSDFSRQLSDRGRADAQMMARALASVHPHVKSILTSPLARAVETGGIFGRELGREPETSRRLTPGFSPDDLLDAIFSQSKDANVVIIGHQPDMSSFISHLISPAHAAMVSMSTCAIACLELDDDGSAHLRWLITPEVISQMNAALQS